MCVKRILFPLERKTFIAHSCAGIYGSYLLHPYTFLPRSVTTQQVLALQHAATSFN